VLGGSGFLAVYMVGLAFGDIRHTQREPVVAFHRGLAMVAEIGMFFAFGLLVFPSQFGPVVVDAILIALVTVLVARPVASTVASIGQGFSRAERVLLAGAGLRGAVPLILATFALIAGVPRGIELLNIVFLAVVLSASFQGRIVHSLAAWLLPGDKHSVPERHGAPNMGVRTHTPATRRASPSVSMRKESL
jgi:cell volume regulation protein A